MKIFQKNRARFSSNNSRSSRNAIESLETRRLLSTVIVNTIQDTSDGITGPVFSLRDAILIANDSSSPTTIEFDPTVFATPQVILLNGTHLTFTNQAEPTTITGPAAGVTISGNFQSQIFQIFGSVTVNMSMLTFEDAINPTGYGGAIENTGIANISNVEFISNSANDGGGIFNYQGATLNLIDSCVAFNTATIGNGGLGSLGTATLINDTIYGNKSPSGTGGFGEDGTATIDDCTITQNAGADFVGGVYTGDGVTTINNTIIAGNMGEASGVVPDVYGHFYSGGYNLIGATDGSSGWTANDLTGTALSPLAANLGSLQDNGAYTESLLPQSNSPALSGGSIALIPSGVTTDQRGVARTIDGIVDIGAAEVGGTPVLSLPTVTTISAFGSTITTGDSDIFFVIVKPSQGNVIPTGSVAIYEHGALEGTYTLNAVGSLDETLIPEAIPNGTTFQAVYSGDNRYASSTSNIISVTDKDASVYENTSFRPSVGQAIQLAGAAIHVTDPIRVTNPGATQTGTFTFALDINTSGVGLDSAPLNLQTLTRKVTLKTKKTLSVTLSSKAKLPTTLTPGTYYYVAEVTDPSGGVDFLTIPTPVNVVAPVVTLAATAATVKPATVTIKKLGTIAISIEDTGNIAATGTLVISVLPSVDGSTAYSSTPLATFSHRESINPGKTGRYTLHIKVPAALAEGTYYPLASISLDGVSASAVGALFSVTAVTTR